MTTIAACVKDGVLAMAADSQMTYCHSNRLGPNLESKIVVRGGYIFGISGGAILVQHILAHADEAPDPPYETHELRRFMIRDFLAWFRGVMKAEEEWRNPRNGERGQSDFDGQLLIGVHGALFQMDAFSHLTQLTRFGAVGSGEDFALGAMAAIEDEIGPSPIPAVDIVSNAVRVACRFDLYSSEPAVVAVQKVERTDPA